jgi:hypothetical protein
MKPCIGLPTEAVDTCAHAYDLGGPFCDATPTVHLLVDADGWGTVALASCTHHAPIARETGAVLAEHPYEALCAGDDDCWSSTPPTQGDAR